MRFRPTICARREKAQLIERTVCSRSVSTPPLTPPVISNVGFTGSPGFGNVHGWVPSITSSGVAPAWSAAASTNSLMLEPVWLGASARFTSRSPGMNPLPPTIARIAPGPRLDRGERGVDAERVVGQLVAGVLGPGLDERVERGVDAQTAAVQARVPLLVGGAEDVLRLSR